MPTRWILVSSLVGIDGHAALEGPIEEVAKTEAREAEDLLKDLGIPVQYTHSFCLLTYSFSSCWYFWLEKILWSTTLSSILLVDEWMNVAAIHQQLVSYHLYPCSYMCHYQILFSIHA